MLRRTKAALDGDNYQEGRALLPLRRFSLRVLELSPDERAVYSKVSSTLQTRFSQMQQDEQAGIHQNYDSYFAKLMKWRQSEH